MVLPTVATEASAMQAAGWQPFRGSRIDVGDEVVVDEGAAAGGGVLLAGDDDFELVRGVRELAFAEQERVSTARAVAVDAGGDDAAVD
jgi:hypothetical protein